MIFIVQGSSRQINRCINSFNIYRRNICKVSVLHNLPEGFELSNVFPLAETGRGYNRKAHVRRSLLSNNDCITLLVKYEYVAKSSAIYADKHIFSVASIDESKSNTDDVLHINIKQFNLKDVLQFKEFVGVD